MNQTLITALGHAFNGADFPVPVSLAALDSQHAAPGSTCILCHQSMDPMRQYFRQAYSLNFSPQTNAQQQAMPGMFAFDGVNRAGTGIADLGAQLAAHPDFAMAWTLKLCAYARSTLCLPTDPEVMRVASVFQNSNFSWNALVLELFSSPLITDAADTATADTNGEIVPIARQAHLCASLSNRLGIVDICGLNPSTQVPSALQPVQTVAAVLPSDGYSRGSTSPIMANSPGLVFRTSLESICTAVANQVVDQPQSLYQSSAAPAAIGNMVHNLMVWRVVAIQIR